METESESYRKPTTKRIPRGQWKEHLKRAGLSQMLPPLDVCVANAWDGLTRDSSPGFYDLIVLDNGGLYIAPGEEFSKQEIEMWSPNGSHETLSPEAAGIVASLFTFSHLSFSGIEAAGDAFHRLTPLAYQHEEAGKIVRLID